MTYGDVGELALLGDDCADGCCTTGCIVLMRFDVPYSLNDFCLLLLIDFPARCEKLSLYDLSLLLTENMLAVR